MGALLVCAACWTSVGLGLQAAPSPAGDGEPASSVIIVTGERIERSVRETPSSVAVLTQEQLERLGGTDRLEELLDFVPNVQMTSDGLGPSIRGQDSTGVLRDLPAFLGGNRPRVALQVDGRTAGYWEFVFGTAPLWDVRQMEVFRSPQTTTQGRNSIAGAIFIRTNDPVYRSEGRARAIHASLATWQGSAMVSGPIVNERLAFRLAADLRRARPSSDIVNSQVGADPDTDRYGLVRFKLLAEPAALPGLRIITTVVHSEAQSPQINGVRRPFRARKDPSATYGVFRTRIDAVTTDLTVPIADRLDGTATVSLGDTRSRRFAPTGLGQARIRNRDASAEARLNWRPSPSIRASGGVHYLRTKLDQQIDITRVGLGIGEFKDVQRSRGLFGEVEATTERLTVTAGLRYQVDRQDRSGFTGLPNAPVPLDFEKKFDALLPKLSVAYDLSDDIRAGLLVQRAYNPGGATFDTVRGELDTFGAERLWNYEAFIRASLGTLSIAANIFYNDIDGSQRTLSTLIPIPGGGDQIALQIGNAPKSHSYGAELESTWKATQRLRLHAALGLLRTRIDKTLVPSDLTLYKQFQRSPGFTASGGIDWTPVDRLNLSARFRHNAGYFSDDRNSPALRVDSATRIDTNAAWTLGRFTVSAYARNILEDFSLTYMFSETFATAAPPREFGVGIEARF